MRGTGATVALTSVAAAACLGCAERGTDLPGTFRGLSFDTVFEVDDPGRFRGISLFVWADDAFVAYLNGDEVGRDRAGAEDVRMSSRAFAIEPWSGGASSASSASESCGA